MCDIEAISYDDVKINFSGMCLISAVIQFREKATALHAATAKQLYIILNYCSGMTHSLSLTDWGWHDMRATIVHI